MGPVKKADRFYRSDAWRTLRLVALRRDGWRCTVCGRSVAGRGEARVDHIKRRKDRPDLELELSNIRVLCPSCDNQSHREKATGNTNREERFVIRGCGPDGWPLARANK